MRSGVQQANQTFNTANNDSSGYGANASTIGANLQPFLLNRLQNAPGYSQQDLTAMLTQALGSAGGSTSGITGQANLQAARTRNDAGFSTALAEAARERTKAAAQTSEGIAADNTQLKQKQQGDAANLLSSLFKTDVGAQGDFLNEANQATQTGIEAQKTGWFQNLNQILQTLSGGAANAASAKKVFG